MKSKLIKGLTIIALVSSVAACEMDHGQRNTAAGIALGGAAGGLLGGDATTALGGAALGGVIGSQVNKSRDRDYDVRDYRQHRKYKNFHKKHHRRHRGWDD